MNKNKSLNLMDTVTIALNLMDKVTIALNLIDTGTIQNAKENEH